MISSMPLATKSLLQPYLGAWAGTALQAAHVGAGTDSCFSDDQALREEKLRMKILKSGKTLHWRVGVWLGQNRVPEAARKGEAGM